MGTRAMRAAGLAGALVAAALPGAAVAQKQTLHLTTVAWQPFYGPGLDGGGPITRLTRAAVKEAGYTLKVTYQPWQRAYSMARVGEYDGLMGAYKTKKRAKSFAYTDAFYNVKVGFVARKSLDKKRYDKLCDLKKYIIAYNDGWAYPNRFEHAQCLQKIPVANHKEGMKLLVRGKVDLIAIAQSVFRHQVDTVASMAGMSMDDFVFLDPLLMQGSLHLAISRERDDAEAIAKKLDKALVKLRRDGTYGRVMGLFSP